MINAILLSLVIVVTMFISLPMGSFGYLNFGDLIILLAGYFIPPPAMFVIAGGGSCLADLFSGYGQYALITLFIKGIEGFVVAWLVQKRQVKFYFAALIGVIIMVLSYGFFEVILTSNVAMFIPAVLLNCIQGFTAFVVAVSLLPIVKARWKGL